MNNAPIEYEVKFFPIDIDATQEQLKRCGATIKEKERLMRRCVFAYTKNPNMKCTYIRVRDEGDKVSLSAKQHATDGKIDSQKEYEATVNDFETTCAILLSAGLIQTGYQENRRETWIMPDGTLVELETWPLLPDYLEIEGKSTKAVKQTAEALNLNWNEHIVQSNDYLYARHFNVDQKAALERLTHLTFATADS